MNLNQAMNLLVSIEKRFEQQKDHLNRDYIKFKHENNTFVMYDNIIEECVDCFQLKFTNRLECDHFEIKTVKEVHDLIN